MNNFILRIAAVTLSLILIDSQLVVLAHDAAADTGGEVQANGIISILMKAGAAEQSNQKPLTNDDISKMIVAGLPESTIVQVIQRGPAAFDTSPDALIKLKRQGATPRIMDAMLGPNAPAPAGTVSAPSEKAATPSNKGVFVQSADGWKRIEEVSSIEVRSVGNITSRITLGIKESRVICVFRGENAEFQLSDRRPVFRISSLGASVRDVYIVALRLNPDRRDLEMGRAGLIKKASFGFRKRDIRDVEVKRLGEDLLEAKPKQDLEPGEYIMVLGGVSMARSNSAGFEGTTGYDFGIGGPR